MHVVTLPPPRTAAQRVRCECVRCGAHVMVRASWQLAGQCGNCRGFELRALTPPDAPPPPAAAPALAAVDVAPQPPVALPVRRVA